MEKAIALMSLAFLFSCAGNQTVVTEPDTKKVERTEQDINIKPIKEAIQNTRKANDFLLKAGSDVNAPTYKTGASATYRKNFDSSELAIGDMVIYSSPFKFDSVLVGNSAPTVCRRNIRDVAVGSNVYKEEFSLSRLPACDMRMGRIVGLPGDVLDINPEGRVWVNDKQLKEKYISNWCKVDDKGLSLCKPMSNYKVPPKTVVILGDNRANSYDSRYFPGGPGVPVKEIIGISVTPL